MNNMKIAENVKIITLLEKVGIAKWSCHQAGNERVMGLNPSTSRQSLSPFSSLCVHLLKADFVRSSLNNVKNV